jgi:hypothetical protein
MSNFKTQASGQASSGVDGEIVAMGKVKRDFVGRGVTK